MRHPQESISNFQKTCNTKTILITIIHLVTKLTCLISPRVWSTWMTLATMVTVILTSICPDVSDRWSERTDLMLITSQSKKLPYQVSRSDWANKLRTMLLLPICNTPGRKATKLLSPGNANGSILLRAPTEQLLQTVVYLTLKSSLFRISNSQTMVFCNWLSVLKSKLMGWQSSNELKRMWATLTTIQL